MIRIKRRIFFTAYALLLILVPNSNARVYNVSDYTARGNKIHNEVLSVQSAIDAIAKKLLGIIYITLKNNWEFENFSNFVLK